MKDGVDEEQLRLDRLQQMLGEVGIGAASQSRYAYDPDALELEQTEQVEVSRIFYEYSIAGLEHVSHDQIERLAGPAGHQDVCHVRFNGERSQAHLDLLSKRPVSKRHGVVDHTARVRAHDLS